MYHINPKTGNPGICKASEGQCPFSSKEEHFQSKEEARAFYEESKKSSITLIKYPRTPHLPFSEGATNDDKYLSKEALEHLKSLPELVVTEKMDGGNLTFYKNHFHGRSLDSGTHSWDSFSRSVWAKMRHEIPEGWRISGESLYAKRSVGYENLPGPYLVFGIWNQDNVLLSWKETEEWCDLLNLPHVPVLYKGGDFNSAIKVWKESLNEKVSEGFVLRNSDSFKYSDFDMNIAKYVRKNHVQTSADWRHRDDFEVNTFSKIESEQNEV